MSTQQVSHETDASLVQAIIGLIGGSRADPVIVVGSRHIELMVQLAHYGFLDVTCRGLPAGPGVGTGSAGIIIVPAVNPMPEWATVVPQLARALQPGGVLFVTWSGALSPVGLRQLQKLLRQCRLSFIRKHLDRMDLDILCCRKAAALATEAA